MVEISGTEEQLLQDYFRKIENAITEFCSLDTLPEDFTLHTATIQQFNACLQYVSRSVFVRPFSSGNSNRTHTTIDINNIYILSGLLEYYVYICNMYSKVPSLYGYSLFIGVSYNAIFDWINGKHYSNLERSEVGYSGIDSSVTAARSRLLKTITKLNENTLLERLENHSNPVGMIAAGNVVHNWDGRKAAFSDNAKQIESSVIASKYLQLETDQNEIVSDFETIPENNSNNWE